MMLLHYRPVPAKVPKRRSRAGCVHCKEKKKKCNEGRPQCDRCIERGLKCLYEPVKPRKRRRTTTAMEQGQQRTRSVTSDPGPRTGYPSNSHSVLSDRIRNGFSAFRQHSMPSLIFEEKWNESGVYDSPISSLGDCNHAISESLPPLHEVDEEHMPIPIHILPSSCTAAGDKIGPITAATSLPHSFSWPSRRPTSSNLISPPLSKPARNSAYLDLGMMTPISMENTSEYHSPAFSEYGQRRNRRILVEHFTNVLSQLLVVQEESGNAFRDLLIPLAGRSPPVMNTIYAVSAAHMEYRGVEAEERSLDFHSRTLQGLAHLIADPVTTRDEALAVIVLLIYYEIIRSGSPNVLNSHLRGALSIIQERRASHAPTCAFLEKTFRYLDVICSLSFGTSPISGTIDAPVSGDTISPHEVSTLDVIDAQDGSMYDLLPVLSRLALLQELRLRVDHRERELPGRQVDSLRQDLEPQAVDLELTLLPWNSPRQLTNDDSAALLPHPAASVTSPTRSSGSIRLGAATTPQHSILTRSTHSSTSPASTSPCTNNGRLQSARSIGEANKQAIFVHLSRCVHAYSRTTPKVQHHAKLCLQACLRVIIFDGPTSALLWPLFTAACEAVEEVDRNVARTVFRHLETRQGMCNIMRAWEVAEDVWRRVDEGEMEITWRVVALAMGEGLVLV